MKKRKQIPQKSQQNRGEQSYRLLEGGELPKHLVKADKIQIHGYIQQSCHGIYHVDLENGMKCLATARKMDAYMKVNLLMGDKVVVEIPPESLSANEPKVRGRIIWRCRT